ncbi:MAG TPA: hypothetical protein VK967_08885 [Methylotenera sp.]|nr:hypothetical protein [Methylotenera sp.]
MAGKKRSLETSGRENPVGLTLFMALFYGVILWRVVLWTID